MSSEELERRRDDVALALSLSGDPAARLAELADAQDRVIAAVIAYRNRDMDGVNAVLQDVGLLDLHELLFSLLVAVGEAALGPEGFQRALFAWRDATTGIDPNNPPRV